MTNEPTTLHAHDYPDLVAAQERDVTPRRVWVPAEWESYTVAEWRELQALARELGGRALPD